MGALLPLALTVVPELAKLFIGGNGADIIGKIAGAAQDVFGTTSADAVKAQMDADASKLEQFKTALQALAASDIAQDKVNEVEAASPMFFVAGWRPFIGWVCGFGLAYQYIALPFLTWLLALVAVSIGKTIPALPPLDIASLLTLVGGMLGLGTLRYMDKKVGVDTTEIQKPKTSPFKLFR